MEEKPKFWLDSIAHIILRLPWPSDLGLRVLSITLSVIVLSLSAAILVCLPDHPVRTMLNILKPVSEASLIVAVNFGLALAVAFSHLGISLLRRSLREFPDHVLSSKTRDFIWQQVCKAIRRADLFSFQWAHSCSGVMWVVIWFVFMAYSTFVVHSTIQSHAHTVLYLMLTIGICASSVLYAGISLLYSGLWSMKHIEGQITDGLKFDPADPYSKGGLSPLMKLVNRLSLMWFFVSVITVYETFPVLTASGIEIPETFYMFTDVSWGSTVVSYPLDEKSVIALIVFLELVVTFLMICVWIKGDRWIADQKKRISFRLAERIRQDWESNPIVSAATIAQLQLVRRSGSSFFLAKVFVSASFLTQIVNVGKLVVALLSLLTR
jgi:hypothetical protein